LERHGTYDRLISPIEDRMMRSIWAVAQQPQDAEEALQNALAVVWRRLPRIERHPNPHALVLRICINAAYDVVRANARRRAREAHAEARQSADAESPADVLIRREQRSVVMRAIKQLSRNQATAVILRLIHGESYEEIGRILGCRNATARKHVERGRERLRRLLAPLIDEGTI
jgi:RNA polymerase sigma factor (sigma-70 family)